MEGHGYIPLAGSCSRKPQLAVIMGSEKQRRDFAGNVRAGFEFCLLLSLPFPFPFFLERGEDSVCLGCSGMSEGLGCDVLPLAAVCRAGDLPQKELLVAESSLPEKCCAGQL